jgi:hypothetical protein
VDALDLRVEDRIGINDLARGPTSAIREAQSSLRAWPGEWAARNFLSPASGLSFSELAEIGNHEPSPRWASVMTLASGRIREQKEAPLRLSRWSCC